MPRYKIDENGNKYRFSYESGEWELIEGEPVGESESLDADKPDETLED